MTNVDFYFDPACPWTWITSRWVVEVAPQRGVDVTWLPFSLRHRNRDNPHYDSRRAEFDAQHPGMRVIEAARQRVGNDAVARLYTALGTLIHHDGDPNLTRLAEVVSALGLDELLDARTDAALDGAIEASTERGLSIVGQDAGIPIIVPEGATSVFFGPVLSPAPTGDAALALWDAFTTLSRFDGLAEIKRTRTTGPVLAARPAAPF